MNAARALSSLARGSARRPRLVIVLALALGLGAAALSLRLHPTAATSSFVSSSSPEYRATQRFYRAFGEEPVEVLVRGNLQQLVLSSDIVRLLGLEGCLSGNVPLQALPGEGGVSGPCGQLARAHTVKFVLGPGTFINEAASQIDEQLTVQTHQAEAEARQAQSVVQRAAIARGLPAAEARALGQQASKATLGRFQESLATIALEYGLTSQPSIEDRSFVSTLVFNSSQGLPAGTPKQRFAYLFPSRNAALVSVRLKPGLPQATRAHTIDLIRQAVAMPQWHLQHGESYLVTGEPVIVSDLTSSISHSLELLLLAVLVVMAVTLLLVFGGRPRLLPLGLALLACALTFGVLSLVGASLTIATVAVLPVLVGLAVDYSIQLQSRASIPTITLAATASAAAMLVLLLSPVPMVRGFGVLLVVGIALALLCALTAGGAVLALSSRGGEMARIKSVRGTNVFDTRHLLHVRAAGRLARGVRAAGAMWLGAVSAALAAAWRGARELLRDNALTRGFERAALSGAVRNPLRVLVVGLVLAVIGWGLDTQTHVQTDITKLVPQGMGSLQNLNALEQESGVGGELDLMVSGRNVATPSTISWMSSYESSILHRFGYGPSRGCGKALLCPAFSLPDLFSGQAVSGSSGTAAKLTQGQVDALLDAIPPYFSQAVITPDRHDATLAFGIRLMSLERQQQLIEAMRARLHPPRGVSAALVGLPVLAAQSAAAVASPWRRLEVLLVGLAAVAVVLLLAFRGDRRRAVVPLIPVVLASGWSALVLFAVRVPLNPMSVMLGALVIAISTEFSVLLSERHRQERLAGYDTLAALRRAYRQTGSAVAASGVTAIAGFGVLALSNITMLRDFGLVTLVDLSVSLVGVLVALPAALVVAGSGEARRRRARALEERPAGALQHEPA